MEKRDLQSPILPQTTIQRIDSAIGAFAPANEVEFHKRSLDQLICGFPPIVTDPNFAEDIESALRGQLDAKNRYVEQIELIARQMGRESTPGIRQRSAGEFRDKPQKDASLHSSSGTINERPFALMRLLNQFAYAEQPELERFAQAIVDDLRLSMRAIEIIDGMAVEALESGDAHRLFASLPVVGGQWGFQPGVPGTNPLGPGTFPLGPDDRPIFDPSPGTIWNPGPEDLDCVRESIDAIGDLGFSPGDFQYSIDEIRPSNPCPGEEVRLVGRGFDTISSNLVIRFPTSSIGRFSDVDPVSVSATEIRVIVPDDATCGFIEITLGEPLVVQTCLGPVEFGLSNTGNVEFDGGRTRLRALWFEPTKKCYVAGDRVTVSASACNSTSIKISFLGPDGALLAQDEAPAARRNQFEFIVPEYQFNSLVSVKAEAIGPCGADMREKSIRIEGATYLHPAARRPFNRRRFRNWNENIDHPAVPQFAPSTLEDLVAAVRTVESMIEDDGLDRRIGISGSAFSFTDCTLPQDASNYHLIDTAGLRDIFAEDTILHNALKSDLNSALPSRALSEIESSIGELSPVENRLVRVEAGVKLKSLSHELAKQGMTLPTIGGGNSQSLMGVLSTGSHGSTAKLPPIADFVRAIHLVGPGGQQWWIEPRANSISQPDRIESLRGNALDPCIEIVYDDGLFNTVLMAMGAAGVVYSLVFEVIDDHHMRYITRQTSWDQAKENITGLIDEPATPQDWWTEITVFPFVTGGWAARYSTANLTTDPLTPCRPLDDDEPEEPVSKGRKIARAIFGAIGVTTNPLARTIATTTVALAVTILTGMLASWILLETLRLGGNFISFRWRQAGRIRENIRTVSRFFSSVTAILWELVDLDDDDLDEKLYEKLPDLINSVWRIGFFLPVGRQIFEAVQLTVISDQRPIRNEVLVSDLALRSQEVPKCVPEGTETPAPDIPAPTPWPTQHISPGFERLVESQEYVLPAGEVGRFVDALIAAADEIRGAGAFEGEPLLAAFPIRFTRKGRAHLAIQRNEGVNAHVEVFVMERLDGANAYIQRVREIAFRFGAVPHWGQLHDENQNFFNVYGSDLVLWRSGIRRIRRESNGYERLFENHFCTSRNLIVD